MDSEDAALDMHHDRSTRGRDLLRVTSSTSSKRRAWLLALAVLALVGVRQLVSPTVVSIETGQHARPVALPTPLSASSPFARAPRRSSVDTLPFGRPAPSPLPRPVAASVWAPPPAANPDIELAPFFGAAAVIIIAAGALRIGAVRGRRALPRVFVTASLLVLTGCGAEPSPRTTAVQSPQEYLNNALDWIDEHSLVRRSAAEVEAARAAALEQAPTPQTHAAAYAAIRFALNNLQDASAFFLEPADLIDYTGLGVTALYPDGLVVFVEPNSPAAHAGIREGDRLITIDGAPLAPLGGGPRAGYGGTWFVETGRRPTYTLELLPSTGATSIGVEIARTRTPYEGEPTARQLDRIGYVELPWDGGWGDYPLRTQRAIAATEDAHTCGWIVDIRRNIGGDFWAYLAAAGPLLGDGDAGAFVFPDGHREKWSHSDGKVLWEAEERGEGFPAGPLYVPNDPMLPVAVLTSRATFTAGELVRVAFEGRPRSRSFGESTGGRPVLLLHTPLSDGALVSLAAAFAADRNGQVYDGPIQPDQDVAVEWSRFGSNADPVVLSALEWLHAQPECSN